MALAIDQREREGILILALVGSLTMGRENTAFRTAVQSYIAAGRINIILDCSRLGNIDSAGVGALVFFHVALRLACGRVVLLNMAQTQMDLLVSAKLRVLFDVFLDQQDAVISFFPDRALNRWDVLEFAREQNAQPDTGAGETTHAGSPHD